MNQDDANGAGATPRTAILVVNFHSAASVAELLDSVADHAGDADFRVAVVDNSCDDAAWQDLQAGVAGSRVDRDRVTCVRSESNLGYAAGNNLAFDSLAPWHPEVVLVINPDVTLESGTVAEIAKEIASGDSRIFGARTVRPGESDGGLWEIRRRIGASRELDADESTSGFSDARLIFPSGHLIGIRAGEWNRAEGFSGDFFLFSEEIDLVLRLGLAPADVGLLSGFRVTHESGLTSGSSTDLRLKSETTYFHATRSRVILFRKHKRLSKFTWSVVSARLLWAVGVAIRAGLSDAAAVVRGVRSGLAWKPRAR